MATDQTPTNSEPSNPPAAPDNSPRQSSVTAGSEVKDLVGSITQSESSLLDKALDEAGVFDKPVDGKASQSLSGSKPAASQTPPADGDGTQTPTEKKDEPQPHPAKPGEAPPVPPAPKPGDGTPPAPPAAPETKMDPEIDGIEKPRGLNPKNEGNWNALREKAKEYKGKFFAMMKENEDLKKLAGKPDEKTEKELTELRSFRRTFDIQNDPYFVEKYDKKISANNEEAYSILKKFGMADDRIESIKAAGGLAGTPDKYWEEEVFKPLAALGDKDADLANAILKKMVSESKVLTVERKKEVDASAKGQPDWLKQREEQQIAARKEETAAVVKELEELQAKLDWAKEKPIPENATPEQRKELEAHNAFFNETVERLKLGINPPDLKTRVHTAVAACMAFEQARRLMQMAARLELVERENAKLKGAGVTSNAGKSSPASASPKTITDLMNMKNIDAIEAGMSAAGI